MLSGHSLYSQEHPYLWKQNFILLENTYKAYILSPPYSPYLFRCAKDWVSLDYSTRFINAFGMSSNLTAHCKNVWGHPAKHSVMYKPVSEYLNTLVSLHLKGIQNKSCSYQFLWIPGLSDSSQTISLCRLVCIFIKLRYQQAKLLRAEYFNIQYNTNDNMVY